jgi:putative transposase
MPYWQLFYHIVWATKNREPLLTPEAEPIIYGYLRNKALGLEANVYALNGYLDHVHIVTSIPPKIAVSKFVGQIKAVASVKYNQSRSGAAPFYWQEEFGAFSFDRKRLPNVVAYVENQKIHHANNNLIPILERDIMDDVLREPPALYNVTDKSWWREMLEME